MTTLETYSLFADASYRDIRGPENTPVIPDGWTKLDRTLFGLPANAPGANGFSAEVYRQGSEVVIAYQGTNPEPFTADGLRDWLANASLALGFGGAQLEQGALFFQEVKNYFVQQGQSVSITLAGHSLGAGIAGLVSVFFGVDAKVFAPAPFEKSANVAVAQKLKQFLNSRGFSGSALQGLDALLNAENFAQTIAQREAAIEGRYIDGEAVAAIRDRLPTLVGSLTSIPVGASELGAIGRHSMQLHGALLNVAELQSASQSLPPLLRLIADPELYSVSLRNEVTKDFLQRLLEFQFGAPGVVANDMLRRFALDAIDLVKEGAIAQPALREAAITALIEFYNFVLTNPLDFIKAESEGVSFDLTQIEPSGATNKVTGKLKEALEALIPTIVGGATNVISPLSGPRATVGDYKQWFIEGGASGLTATATGTLSAAMVGGAQGDVLTGGGSGDFLFGGGGNDQLTGGAGDDLLFGEGGDDTLQGGLNNDYLDGGIGSDTYRYILGGGKDTILDVDGLGSIQIGGFTIGEVFRSTRFGEWKTTGDGGGEIILKLIDPDSLGSSNTRLIISGAGLGGSNDQIEIQRFEDNPNTGYLGIKLKSNRKVEVLPGRTANTFTDDIEHTAQNGVHEAMTERGAQAITVALSEAASEGDKIQVSLGNLAGDFAALLGDELVSFANGTVEIELREGQNTVTFAVINTGDVDSDAQIELSAAWTGGDTPVSHAITLDLDAREEPEAGDAPNTTRTIRGDLEPIDNDPNAPGVQYVLDDLGNPRTTGAPEPDRNDVLNDSTGNDLILPGGGDDWVRATRGGDDVIDAGSGQDYIEAGDGNDVIDGGADRDELMGQAGDDHIKGGQGNDVLRGDIYQTGPQGDDILEGGAGEDIVYGMDGDDFIYGEDEVDLEDAIDEGESHPGEPGKGDFLEGLDGSDIVIGSHRDDVVTGGDGDDILVGGGGNDFLVGDWTYDVITGWTFVKNVDGVTTHYSLPGTSFVSEGSGDDVIYAGGGDDDVLANDGDDLVFGEAGADTVFAGAGSDTVHGGEGDDRVAGGEDDDFLDGGEGDDLLFGQDGDDALFGGDGDDRLQGDEVVAGDDYLDGEAGADTLIGVGGADQLFGGEGDDILGGDSDDTEEEDQGDDELYGEEGDDQLLGYAGDDYIEGNEGDDRAWGYEGEDTIYGGEGDDELAGDLGNDDDSGDADYLDGEEGDDLLLGEGGDDVLVGGEGDDQLQSGFGDDEVYGDEGDDILFGQAGDDYLDGGDGDDIIVGEDNTGSAEGGDDTIVAGAGDDIVLGETGDDSIDGGEGDDIMLGGAGDDAIDGGAGDDQMDAGEGDDSAGGGEGDDLVFGGEGDDSLSGDEGEDVLVGAEGDDDLAGGDDSDTLFGGEGNDSIAGGAGEDFLQGDEGDDSLSGGEGRDLYGYARGDGRDTVSDSGGNTLLVFGYSGQQVSLRVGSLVLDFGGGDEVHIEGIDLDNPFVNPVIDTFVFDDVTLTLEQLLSQGFEVTGTPEPDLLVGTGFEDTIDALESGDVVLAKGGDDLVFAGMGDDVVRGGDGHDEIYGDEGDDVLLGEADDDILEGGAGDDQIEGGEGDDTLYGGEGVDSLAGGLGHDTYIVDELGDEILEDADAGTDTVEASLDYTLGDNVEDLILVGGADLNGTGNAADNFIGGNTGSNLLLGLDGDDLLEGGGGFDTLDGGAGNDALVLTTGGFAAVGGVLLGGEGDDFLAGNEGDDYLDGGTGVDEMQGAAGNDLYIVDESDDQVAEQDLWHRDIFSGDVTVERMGIDSVESSVTFELSKFVENLTLTGSADIDGTGNSEINTIVGNEGDNVLTSTLLDGLNDNLAFGPGAVSYIGIIPGPLSERLWDRALRRYFEGEITSDELDSIGVQISVDAREGDYLYGNGGDDRLIGGWDHDALYGGDGNDFLVGSGGSDYMEGGAGDDSYVVDRNFEYVFGYANTATIRYEDHFTDSVYEEEDGGHDTVYSNADFYTLGDGVEDLVLLDLPTRIALGFDSQDGLFSFNPLPVSGEGNDLDNRITGNLGSNELYGGAGSDVLLGREGDDWLDGGEGADQMAGGTGNDGYYVDQAGDVVVEEGFSGSEQGHDHVLSDISYALTANVEDLELQGVFDEYLWGYFDNLDGTGNELDNSILGNDGVNLLSGGEGNDFLDGRGGDDTLAGGGGNDELFGGFGADLMTGGDGNDVYYVDNEFDVTTEDSDVGGSDLVYSSMTHTLGENIENLELVDEDANGPAGHINGTGNELNNSITGNNSENVLLGLEGDDEIFGRGDDDWIEGGEGNDVVDGGNDDDVVYGDGGDDILAGGEGHDELYGGDGQDRLDGGSDQDALFGGAGDDVYVVDWSADQVTEALDEGLDQVFSSDSFELSDNVENLTLLGDYSDNGFVQGYSGIGNDLANAILGNDGSNFLQGRGGDDQIDGRAGSDDIYGEGDNDELYGGDDAIFTGSGYGGYGGGEEAFAFNLDKQPDTGDDEGGGGYGGYGGFEVLARNNDWIEGGGGTDQIDGGSGNDRLWGDLSFDARVGTDDFIYGGDDGLSIDANNGFVDGGEGAEANGRMFLTNDDELHGGGGKDHLDGGSGNDNLFGDDGDDTLFGGADGPLNTSNRDLLDGGAGIDQMAGGTDDDRYWVDGSFVLSPRDVMTDCGVLQLGVMTRVWTYDAVIEHEDEGYDRVFAAAEITLADHVESLEMLNFDTSGGGSALQFGGGNALDNEIFGNSNDNRLEGAGGNDTLFGADGNDVLEGGAGDDQLWGDGGNDTYNLTPGTGRDVVNNFGSPGELDVVHATYQLTLADLTLSTNGADVFISITGTDDSLTLANWFTNPASWRVDRLVFCDGAFIDEAQITALALAHQIDANDDTAFAFEDGDVVVGNVLANDTTDGVSLAVVDHGIHFGSFGTLDLAADGSYTYTPYDLQWLSQGETYVDTFSYTAQDDVNARDSAVLNVEVTGVNDVPLWQTQGTAGEVTEDFAFVSDFEIEMLQNGDFDQSLFGWNFDGEMSFFGVQDEEAFFGAIGAETVMSQEEFTSVGQQYAIRFRLRGGAATDATFRASWNGEVLAAFENVVFDDYSQFTYLIEGTDSFARLEFAMRNDPDFWYLDDIEMNVLVHEVVIPEFQTAGGLIDFIDVDFSDQHSFFFSPQQADGYLGTFDAWMVADSAFRGFGTVEWSFAVENDALQYLTEGDVLFQYYDLTVVDPYGADTAHTVTVAINGTNDAPLAETDEAFAREDEELVASGNVLENDADVDQGDTFSLVTTGTFAGQYGTLVLDESGDYTYTLDNASVQFIALGGQVEDYFDYEIVDDAPNPLSSIGTLVVYIEGTNDAPVAAEDAATVQEDVELFASGNVLDNDTDVDQDTVLEVATPGEIFGLYGVLTLESDGSYTFALDNENAVVQALAEGATLEESFLYTVTDGLETDDALLTLTIVGTNDAPEAADDTASVQEDLQPVATGNVLANDTDLDSVLTVAEPGSFAGAWGTLALGLDGSYTYTLGNAARVLTTGDTVLDVFTYQAFDGFETSEAELVVTIHGNNDGPIAAGDLAGVQEDGSLTAIGNVLTNDRDPDAGSVLSVAMPGVYAGDYGTLTLSEDGSYTYELDNDSAPVQALHQGRTVLDRFSYEASDGTSTDDAVLTVLIAGANDAPVAIDDGASASEDTALIGGRVLDNDTDIDTGTILRVTTPGTYAGSYGTLTITANGGYRYALNNGMLQSLAQGEEVVDTFAYAASDGFATDDATLTITVLGANDAPVTLNDAASVQEDTALSASGNVLANDTDVDAGAVVTVENFGIFAGTYGTLTLEEGGGYSYVLDNALVQSLLQGQSVRDTFAYVATDGIDSTQGTLTVTVHGTNDDPVAVADSAALSEDGVLSATGNVLANDTDVDTGATPAVTASGLLGNDTGGAVTGTTLTVTSTGIFTGIYGTLMLAGDGSYSYMLNNAGLAVQGLADGQIVYDVFDYDVSDGLATSTAQLTFEVTGANDAPVTAGDTAAVQEDVTLIASGNVLDNDTDVDFETELTVGNAGTYGELTLDEDGSFEYVLDNDSLVVQALGAGQTVSDEFTYVATDGIESTEGTLTVTITGTNDAPVTVNDAASVREDVTLTASGNVLGNDTDVDTGTTLRVALPGDRSGAYGVLHLAANGAYTYDLNNAAVQSLAAGQSVTDTFGYAATDGITFTPGELRVAIAGTNDAPVAQNDAAAASEDGSVVVSGNVLTNDADVDAGTTLTVLAPGTLAGAYGTLVLGGNGAYTYTLNNASSAVQALRAGQSVSDAFDYAASDGITSSPARLTVNVAGANDRPVAAADANAVQEDGTLSVTGNVLANDNDVDAGTTLSVFAPNTFIGTYGTLVLGAGGAYTYTLNNASTAVQSLARNQVVNDVFSYEASDGIERSASTLTLTVTGANDAPTVPNAILDQDADAGAPFTFTFAANTFADIDQNDVLAYTAALANGEPLPTWLSFNPATRTFTGTPPGGGGCDCNCEGGAESLQIRVFAADLAGATAAADFNLAIEGGAGGGGQHVVGTNNADTLTGTGCDDLIEGLKGDDTLYGLAGNDVLDGGTGFDKMYGGAGDDVYYVDKTCEDDHGQHGNEGVGNGEDPPPPGHDHNQNDGPGTSPGNPGSQGGQGHHHGDDCDDHNESQCKVDEVVETANQGYDIVYASTDYTLTSNVEELRLTGSSDLDGTGNSLNNVLVGNSGDNELSGGAGLDVIAGGRGDDRLKGGTGGDVYLHDLYGGDDVIEETGSDSDTLLLGQGISASMVRLKRRNDDLVVDLSGSHGSVTVKGWFASSSKRVESIQFADGSSWNVQQIRDRVQSGSSQHDDGGYGDHQGGNNRGEDRDRYDRDQDRDHDRDDGRHSSRRDDDWCSGRLTRPARFDFEQLQGLLGRDNRTLSKNEIAARWRAVGSYAQGVGGDDDGREGAWLGGTHGNQSSSMAASGGSRFGFEGSVGTSRGQDNLRTLEGLIEGFRRL